MKKSLLALSLFVGFALAAATSFPDPIAEFRGRAIPRADVKEQLKTIADLAPEDRTGRQAAVRKILEEFCGSLILNEICHLPEYRDGNAAARRYIVEAHLDAITTAELNKKIDDPAFIKKAIIHLFLAAQYGENAFAVSDGEIEDFYRQNIERFRVAENTVFGIIVVDDREEAETLHARLQQGENFDRLAQQSDDGRERPQPSAAELASVREIAEKMRVNEISSVIAYNHRFFILKLKERTPTHFVPFDQIKDSLKMELVAFREAKLLQRYLEQEITEGNLIIHAE